MLGTKTVLVLGSRGFIGRAVVGMLREAQHAVLEVDCLEPRVHPQDVSMPRRSMLSGVKCADTPYTFLREADIVIHLAAQVGVADSMVDPVRYVRDNTLDTAKFLHRLHDKCVPKKLVVASSMSVYGDPHTDQPIDETTYARPESVYGMTKLDQEQLCLMWGVQHGVPVTALRFFNVYGPGQALHNPYTGVLANFANWILKGEQPVVYEDGLQTRDFIYVDDVADAVVQCAFRTRFKNHGMPFQIFNVCTGVPQTIAGIATQMAVLLGKDIMPHITHTERPGDIRHCIGNNEALRHALPSWQPRTFTEGLEEYAAWLAQSS